MKRLHLVTAMLTISALLVLTACTTPAVPATSVPSSASTPASQVSSAPQTTAFTLLGGLEQSPDALTGVHYCADAPYVQNKTGGLIPRDGVSAAVLTCRRDDTQAYDQQLSGCLDTLAKAFADFQLKEGFQEVITSEFPVPEGDYQSFWLSFGEWEPFLYIFDSGDVYLDSNNGENQTLHFRAADGDQYPALIAAIEQIRATINALPLDYQLELYIRTPNIIKPESKGLQIIITNQGDNIVTPQPRFLVERQEQGSWVTVPYRTGTLASDELHPVGKSVRGEYYSLLLADLADGQKEGKYRLSQTFTSGTETITLSDEYEISAAAPDIGSPLPPRMTPQNQEYCDKYVSMWGFYSPFETDFTEQNYLQAIHTYLTYTNITWARDGRDNASKQYGADIPAEVVESTIQSRFLLTSEQIRSSTPTKTEKPTEYYDPQQNSYHFEGGYGGGSNDAVVSQSTPEGDRLMLVCDWYNVEGLYLYSNEITVRLEENGEFKYLASKTLPKKE